MASKGGFGYNAGVSGIVSLAHNQKVLAISATALESSATIAIDGGDAITLPYGSTDKVSSSITIEPHTLLIGPTIVFTGTKSYIVEWCLV